MEASVKFNKDNVMAFFKKNGRLILIVLAVLAAVVVLIDYNTGKPLGLFEKNKTEKIAENKTKTPEASTEQEEEIVEPADSAAVTPPADSTVTEPADTTVVAGEDSTVVTPPVAQTPGNSQDSVTTTTPPAQTTPTSPQQPITQTPAPASNWKVIDLLDKEGNVKMQDSILITKTQTGFTVKTKDFWFVQYPKSKDGKAKTDKNHATLTEIVKIEGVSGAKFIDQNTVDVTANGNCAGCEQMLAYVVKRDAATFSPMTGERDDYLPNR
jgi:FtsZ-interacting cell division protein ZipA